MLLAIFLIIFSAIARRDIRHGIYLVVFSMPLYLWRFSILSIPTTALEIMIYILFSAWIINELSLSTHFYRLKPELQFGVHSLECKFKFLSDRLQYHRLVYGTMKSILCCKLFRGENFVLNSGIILLFSGAVISTALSSDIRASLGILKGWFFDPFLFFIVFINVIKTEREIYSTLKSWLASGIAVSAISIFYLLNNDLTFDGRLHAFFLSPNHLAMYISIPFLIALGFLINKASSNACNTKEEAEIRRLRYWEILKKQITKIFVIPSHRRGIPLMLLSRFTSFKRFLSARWRIEMTKKRHLIIQSNRRLSIAILIIILIPLYFTHSYGAFLGIFAGGLYLVVKNIYSLPPRRSLRLGTVAGKKVLRAASPQSSDERPWRGWSSGKNIYWLGFIILLFFGLAFLSSGKLNQIINSDNRSSFHSRLMIWSSTEKIIKDNPIFGIGPGTFQEEYLSYSDKFTEPYLEWAVPQPHNIFLAFYLQTGLIGFIGFILILFWFFRRKWHYIMPPSNDNKNNIPISQYPINNIFISLMIYTLVHGLVDTTYWKNDLSLAFWLIIGGGLTISKMYAKLQSPDKNTSNLKTK